MAAVRKNPDERTSRSQGPDRGAGTKLNARTILGATVVNLQGEKLGDIDNLTINMNSGVVDFVVIATDTFLGMGGKLYSIPFRELHFDPASRTFTLDRIKDSFGRGSDKGVWPEEKVHNYFKKVISKI